MRNLPFHFATSTVGLAGFFDVAGEMEGSEIGCGFWPDFWQMGLAAAVFHHAARVWTESERTGYLLWTGGRARQPIR